MRENSKRRPIFFPIITPFVFIFALAVGASTYQAQQPVDYTWNPDSTVVVSTR